MRIIVLVPCRDKSASESIMPVAAVEKDYHKDGFAVQPGPGGPGRPVRSISRALAMMTQSGAQRGFPRIHLGVCR
jgi:hypothetical protein